MKRKICVETSVISYLTARPSKTIIGAALSKLLWLDGSCARAMNFLFLSRSGKSVQMKKRLAALGINVWPIFRGIPSLDIGVSFNTMYL